MLKKAKWKAQSATISYWTFYGSNRLFVAHWGAKGITVGTPNGSLRLIEAQKGYTKITWAQKGSVRQSAKMSYWTYCGLIKSAHLSSLGWRRYHRGSKGSLVLKMDSKRLTKAKKKGLMKIIWWTQKGSVKQFAKMRNWKFCVLKLAHWSSLICKR